MSLVLPTASALFPTVSHVLVSVATTGLMRRDQAMLALVRFEVKLIMKAV